MQQYNLCAGSPFILPNPALAAGQRLAATIQQATAAGQPIESLITDVGQQITAQLPALPQLPTAGTLPQLPLNDPRPHYPQRPRYAAAAYQHRTQTDYSPFIRKVTGWPTYPPLKVKQLTNPITFLTKNIEQKASPVTSSPVQEGDVVTASCWSGGGQGGAA